MFAAKLFTYICRRSSVFTNTRNFVNSSYRYAKIVELVPALGESITEGSISKWTKQVGDKVEIDDVVVIIETDKVTVDIKSTNAGIVVAHLATDNVGL